MNAAQRQTLISIILPAYNELTRLPSYLSRIRAYGDATFDRHYEVIVVDDGSADGMAKYLESLAGDWDALLVVQHPDNLGKGAAVRSGMLRGSGELLLFADADGATPIEQEAKLRQAIGRGAELAVGSRVVCGGETTAKRRPMRRMSAWAFRQIVHRSLRMPILDTQCGFKMFRGDVGRRLFAACDEAGYLFDPFILRLALRLGLNIEEVPIEWHDMPGSKLRAFRDAYTMWRGLGGLERRVDRAIQRVEKEAAAESRAAG